MLAAVVLAQQVDDLPGVQETVLEDVLDNLHVSICNPDGTHIGALEPRASVGMKTWHSPMLPIRLSAQNLLSMSCAPCSTRTIATPSCSGNGR